MSARHQHNRPTEKPMDKDLDKCIKKAKKYHQGQEEFYIFMVNGYYYSDNDTFIKSNYIKHFKNIGNFERSKWEELI